MQTPPDDTSRPVDESPRPLDDAPPPAPAAQRPVSDTLARPMGATERPLGITVIAILSAIGGIFGLLASLVLLGLGAATASQVGGFSLLAGLIVLAYSLLSLALAYGFWTLQPWAWPLGIGVQVLGIVQAVLQYLNGGTQIFSLLFSLAIAAGILWYLFQPHVKAAFGRA